MNIYEFSQRWKAANDAIQVNEETGEVFGFEALDSLNLKAEEQLEFYGSFYKEIVGDAKKIDDEIKSLKVRKDSLMKKAESYKDGADTLLKILGRDKFSTPRLVVSYTSPRERTKITDPAKIPDEYKRFKPGEPDKEAIKKAIHSGIDVPGAELEINRNLMIK